MLSTYSKTDTDSLGLRTKESRYSGVLVRLVKQIQLGKTTMTTPTSELLGESLEETKMFKSVHIPLICYK